MYYILYSEEEQNCIPEINNYSGDLTMSFKKGFFLFDPKKYEDYTCWVLHSTIVIEGRSYVLNKDRIFKNLIDAEIIFLKLKIEESISSSFDFFMPKSFNKFVERYNELKEIYPEKFI